MSKAILIIDMPENCSECPLDYDYLQGCTGDVREYAEPDEEPQSFYHRPTWCPLKPLPRLTDPDVALDMKAIHSRMIDVNNTKNALVRFIDGWESALDEIEGKQK